MPASANTTRISSMDALRALAMFLGILLHAVMAYTVRPFEEMYQDPLYHNNAFDLIFFFIHTFRMQLFYLIAGFFFRLLYYRVGVASFIKHRTQRILLPFIIGLFTILPLTYLPGVFNSVTAGGSHFTINDLLTIIHDIFIWRGPLHLWFLYYLSLFYVIGIFILNWRRPLMKKNTLTARILLLGVNPALAAPLLIILSFLTLQLFDSPYIQYTPGLRPRIAYILYYGLFVYAGWVLHGNMPKYFPMLKRRGTLFMTIGIFCAAIVYSFAYFPAVGSNYIQEDWMIKVLMSVTTVTLVLGLLGIFLRFVNAESPVMRYLSDSSYWAYLVHVAIVDAVQIWLGSTSLWGPLKPLISFILPVIISLATYQWFVRYTFIGYYLHGSRKPAVQEKKIIAESIKL
ncbi:glucans biosynthesis protein C [Chitinophaga sp. CF118]|uniref:acyltransferase family protein n=1 Tax=Chitinophaga sp. CF118 TaxID=1884367 RepID=UPI0008E929C9|nr:acyltransferase family protein [Chitinophaga sp. CF118]SFE92995.1 glucans biosynthesis protein C [Chitinophaga sp. CF118]